GGIEAEDVLQRLLRLLRLVGPHQRLDQQGVGGELLRHVVDQLVEHRGGLLRLVLIEVDPPQGEERRRVLRIALAHLLQGGARPRQRGRVDRREVDVDLAGGAQHVEVVGGQHAGRRDLLRRLAKRVAAQRRAALVLGHAVEELRVLDQHVGGVRRLRRDLLRRVEGGEGVVDRPFDGEQLAERELIGGRRRQGLGERGGGHEDGQEGQAGGANREATMLHMRQNSSARRRFTRLSTRLYNVALALKYSHQNELRTTLETMPTRR